MVMHHRKSGDMNIISLSGTLDIYTSIDFKAFFESNIRPGDNRVILDMTNLKYIDSSGIGMLIKELNYIKEINGELIIASLKPALEKVFKVSGLTSYFNFMPEDEFRSSYSN